jgi:hypothetical protein
LTIKISAAPNFKSDEREHLIGVVTALLLMREKNFLDLWPVKQAAGADLLFREHVANEWL